MEYLIPDDIWELIIGKLSLQERGKTSSVCKEWYKRYRILRNVFVLKFRCWSHLRQFSFSFRHRPRQDFIIISILKRATKLRHLQLIDCYTVTGIVLQFDLLTTRPNRCELSSFISYFRIPQLSFNRQTIVRPTSPKSTFWPYFPQILSKLSHISQRNRTISFNPSVIHLHLISHKQANWK